MLLAVKRSFFSIFINITLSVLLQVSLEIEKVRASEAVELAGVDLVTGQNKRVSFSEGKYGTVIIFLSSTCPCSKNHLPALNQLAKEFDHNGFTFVGVHSNANEDFSEALRYFGRVKPSFPIIQDQDAKIATYFEAYKTPHVFVVNPQRKILFQGGVDDSRAIETAKRHFLKEALDAIQKGKEPPEKNVRVLGCEIKRP